MTELHHKLKISNGSLLALACVAILGTTAGTYLGASASMRRDKPYPLGASDQSISQTRASSMAVSNAFVTKQIKSLQHEADEAKRADLSQFVQSFSHGELQLVSEDQGPDGLTAVNLIPTGRPDLQHIIGWVLPEETGIVLGPLLDPNGVNLNVSFEQKLGVAPPPQAVSPMSPQAGAPIHGLPMTPAQIQKFMVHADFASFKQGAGPISIAVFVDANCSVCHGLWDALQQDNGWKKKFTIQWIPVGSFKPTSMAMGASILAGGVKALTYNEIHFDLTQETGGINPSSDPKLLAALEKNTENFEELTEKDGQEPGTPTIVINDKQISVGLPSPAAMAAMTGASFP